MISLIKKLFGARKSELPVWDGDPEKLPEKGKKFIYKGQKYIWKSCKCGCGRPQAFKNGSKSRELTIRLRGVNQGDQMEDVITKFGMMEELITTEGDLAKILHLFEICLDKADPARKIGLETCIKFLEEKGISPQEFSAALIEAKRLVYTVKSEAFAAIILS